MMMEVNVINGNPVMYVHVNILNQNQWKSLQIVPTYLQRAEKEEWDLLVAINLGVTLVYTRTTDEQPTCLLKLINGTYTYLYIQNRVGDVT